LAPFTLELFPEKKGALSVPVQTQNKYLNLYEYNWLKTTEKKGDIISL